MIWNFHRKLKFTVSKNAKTFRLISSRIKEFKSFDIVPSFVKVLFGSTRTKFVWSNRILHRRLTREVLSRFLPKGRTIFKNERCKTLQVVNVVRKNNKHCYLFGHKLKNSKFVLFFSYSNKSRRKRIAETLLNVLFRTVGKLHNVTNNAVIVLYFTV